MDSVHALVVEDDCTHAPRTVSVLERIGYCVDHVTTARLALEYCRRRTYSLLIVDLKLGDAAPDGRDAGVWFIEQLNPSIDEWVLVLSAVLKENALDLLAWRADHVASIWPIPKGDPTLAHETLFKLAQERMTLAKASLAPSLVLTDPAVSRIYDEDIPIIASSELPVLIQGKTGTGKEAVARRIHSLSAQQRYSRNGRAEPPFRDVNCASLSAELATTQLFGHVKGSFTGAIVHSAGELLAATGCIETSPASRKRQPEDFLEWLKSVAQVDEVVRLADQRPGKRQVFRRMGCTWIRPARSQEPEAYLVRRESETTPNPPPGTLFLDEVDSLPPAVQAQLLRVLDGYGFYPFGYYGLPLLPNVRIICASNRLMVENQAGLNRDGDGTMRQDLYWRVAGWPVELPEVHSHEETVAQYLRERAAEEQGMVWPQDVLEVALEEVVRKTSLPGNWREVRFFWGRLVARVKRRPRVERQIKVEDVMWAARPSISIAHTVSSAAAQPSRSDSTGPPIETPGAEQWPEWDEEARILRWPGNQKQLGGQAAQVFDRLYRNRGNYVLTQNVLPSPGKPHSPVSRLNKLFESAAVPLEIENDRRLGYRIVRCHRP